MTGATQAGKWWELAEDTKATTGPERKRRGGPVFIGDVVMPWGGETLLLAVLRVAAEREMDD